MGNVGSFRPRETRSIHGDSSENLLGDIRYNKSKKTFDVLKTKEMEERELRDKEREFRNKFQKYSGRASSLQRRVNYKRANIKKTCIRITKISRWFKENEDQNLFLEPTNAYKQKNRKFVQERNKIHQARKTPNISKKSGIYDFPELREKEIPSVSSQKSGVAEPRRDHGGSLQPASSWGERAEGLSTR